MLSARYRQAADAYAHSAEERALIRFLDKHFPERRRRGRGAVTSHRVRA